MRNRTIMLAAVLLAAPMAPALADSHAPFTDPLPVASAAGPVTSCADPTVLRHDAGYTMVCTTDPLNGTDRDASGELRFRLLPMFTGTDLTRWTHAGDAFDRDPATPTPPPPAWATPTALLWAPEIAKIGERYHLFFAVTDIAGEDAACTGDSAIGHATADSPTGPWIADDRPLIAPRPAGPACDFFWTFDPEVVVPATGPPLILYGSYHGGIEARVLQVAADGTLSTDPATATPVAIPNRYEGAEIAFHDGWHYLFVSASNCCAGPQTGYGVFVARSQQPTGPYLDRDGVPLLAAGVGGTPVLMQRGDGWVGPGHNTVLQDEAGDWWTLYHAVEEASPWFPGEPGFTRRPVLLAPITWRDGWPEIGAPLPDDTPLSVRADLSEDFDDPDGNPRWTWLRGPDHGTARQADGTFVMPTASGDLHEDQNDAPVRLMPTPAGDYTVEVRLQTDVPSEGCCHNFVQGGLVIRADDDRYIKLVQASIWETRQVEFAREVPAGAPKEPRYGTSIAGPVGDDWTWLRIAVKRLPKGETYTAYSSRDGTTWRRGATWTHALWPEARIGLVSMGGEGFATTFDDFRVTAASAP